jgi:hypothetical protein
MPEPLIVKDGMRTLGHIVEKKDRLEAFTADGVYLASFPAKSRKEAMRAVSAADRAAREQKETTS